MGVLDLIRIRKKKPSGSVPPKLSIKIFTEVEELENVNSLTPSNGKTGERKAKLPTWYTQSPYGHPRTDDITTLRNLAQMGIVQRCINVILDQVMNADWDIVPVDPEDESSETQALIKNIKDFLLSVNSNEASYFVELRRALTDYFEIGEGILVKSFSEEAYSEIQEQKIVLQSAREGLLREIQAYDASQFHVFIDHTGKILGHWQFNFVKTPPQFFSPREIILFQDQPTTYRLYGRSRVAQIKEFLEMVAAQMVQMKNFYEKGAVFQGFIKTIGFNTDEQKQFEKFLKEKFRSMKHKFGIVHGGKDTDVDFIPLMLNIQDLAFLEGLDFVQRFVMSLFGVTPNELGITDTVNRATAAEQGHVFRRRTIRTLMNMIEYRTNREVIREFDPEGRVEFKFIEETDPQVKKLEQEIAASQLQLMQITINEWRTQQGLDPVPWGDKPFRIQVMEQRQFPQENNGGPSQESGNGKPPQESDSESDSNKEEDEEQENENEESAKILNHSGPDSELVKQVSDEELDARLRKLLSPLESEMLSVLKKIFEKWEEATKNIRLENINPTEIRNLISQIISADELAQEITDVMFSAYETGLRLTDEFELESSPVFSLPDKRTMDYFLSYPLILAERIESRVEQNLRFEILDGVSRGESMQKIGRRIKTIFENLKTWEAERIARTEVTNAATWGRINQLRAFGRTKWQFYATQDERTCPVCKDHHLQTYSIDDLEFKPPLHPQCRCSVLSVINEKETGKSWIPTPTQGKIELEENDTIVKLLTQKYNHEGLSVRQIAKELGLTHQAIHKWIQQFSITKSDEGRWVTLRDGRRIFIHFKPHVGKFISSVKLNPDSIHAFEAESQGIPGIQRKELGKPFKVRMTKKSFEDHKNRTDNKHFKTHQEYLAVINDPDYIWVEQETRRGPKVHFFGKRSNDDEHVATVVMFTRENNMHSIATGFLMEPEKQGEYEQKFKLIFRREENPQK